MNFLTRSNSGLTSAKPRQSIFTLTFFCFLILLLLTATSCSENIFTSPWGNRTLYLDTLRYDEHIITDIRNRNRDASGSQLSENKVGEYHALQAEFLIKFTNFTALGALPDSVELTIDDAHILLYPSNHWGTANTFTLDLYKVDSDTSLFWENISKPADVFASLEGRTEFRGAAAVDPEADSVQVPLELSTVNEWYDRPDTVYSNNGLVLRPAPASDGMLAFYSTDYVSGERDRRPRLRLECSLYDTNGVYLKDSVFTVVSAGDLQRTESGAGIEEDRFFLSQGNIFRSYVMMDSIRTDTLLGPARLINKAEQTLVIDRDYSNITPGDTLYLTARLFRTDSWEEDSISYMYSAYSDLIGSGTDTLRIDISQLLQYLVSTERTRAYEGIHYYLNNEYNDFNYISIDPGSARLEVIYTKVENE